MAGQPKSAYWSVLRHRRSRHCGFCRQLEELAGKPWEQRSRRPSKYARLWKWVTGIRIALWNRQVEGGVVMKTLKEKYGGQYDAKAASEIVKKLVG